MLNSIWRNTRYFENIVTIWKEGNSKMLQKFVIPGDFEILIFECKLSKSNWLVTTTYKCPSLNDITSISEVKKILTYYKSTHKNILLIVEFNVTPSNSNLIDLTYYLGQHISKVSVLGNFVL